MISGFTSKAGGRQAESSLYDRRRSRWPAHLFALFVVVLTSALGVWQLQRKAEKEAYNEKQRRKHEILRKMREQNHEN